MWTKEALHQLIGTKLRDFRFIVVANREPYVHRYTEDRTIEWVSPASGMVTALDPIMQACGGVWIAQGTGGDADRKTADADGRVAVPPDDPSYTLRRLWLTKEQENGFYYGLANEGLWPLCHVAYTRPVFNPRHWQIYREVNELFARAVVEEADGQPTFVFIQDYHFGLLPRMLKEAGNNFVVAQFWHIPWPNGETFGTFPWKEELLDGLLGNDLLGFHLRSHCQYFLDLVDRALEAKIDYENGEVRRGRRATVVRPFPISIDAEGHTDLAQSSQVDRLMERWLHQTGLTDQRIGIGIDRIDYTKGIPERLRALDLFLQQNPEYRERLVFIQIGVPSRIQVRAYKLLDDEIDGLIEEINWKWSTDTWQPILYFKRSFSQPEMMALHRLADFCVVSSLHDGMNLVAKEFVASRFDDGGALILSRFTGAARELKDAILVNPFAVEELADAMREALEMPDDERRRRMHRLRAEVAGNNIFRWAGKIISALLKFDFSEEAKSVTDLLVHVNGSH